MYALLLTLAQLGRSPSGSVAVEGSEVGSTPETTAPSDTEETADTDPTDSQDDSEETEKKPDTEDDFSAYSGEYEGDMVMLLLSDWYDYELEDCVAYADVSKKGEIDGEGSCDFGDGGWANAWGGGGEEYEEIPLTFTGEIDKDGEITGMIEVELDWDGVSVEPMPMEGEIDGEDMIFDFDGDLVTDWFSAEIVGEGELWRD